MGCSIKPERRNGTWVFRNTFFMRLPPNEDRPLQVSDLMRPSGIPPEPAPGPALVWPGNVLKIQFQDGTEMNVASDLSFVGLEGTDFKVAYEAFTRTRAELFGTAYAPELNSKIRRDTDRADGEQ